MKKFFLVSLVAIICVVESFDFQEAELETEEKVWDLYERWGRHHMVWRDVDEKQRRYEVFKANAHYIITSNKKERPFKLGLNKFADMSSHEFRTIYTGCMLKRNRTASSPTPFTYHNVVAADSVDWTANGAVTDVRDQGDQCCNIYILYVCLIN